MFDTFYDDNAEIVCPTCNKSNKLSEGVQSKSFDCTLDNYYVGDVVERIGTSPVVEDYEWCKHCKKRIPIFFGFYNNIFIGLYPSFDTALNETKNFDLYHYYELMFYDKKKYQKRTRQLEYQIKHTIDMHSSVPSKSQYGFMYNIHHNFFEYDIIKTLNNILKFKN